MLATPQLRDGPRRTRSPATRGDDAMQRACEHLLDTTAGARRRRPPTRRRRRLRHRPRQRGPSLGSTPRARCEPTDRRYAAARRARLRRASATVVVGAAPQARVVWVRPPVIDPWWKDADGIYANPSGHAVVDAIAARARRRRPCARARRRPAGVDGGDRPRPTTRRSPARRHPPHPRGRTAARRRLARARAGRGRARLTERGPHVLADAAAISCRVAFRALHALHSRGFAARHPSSSIRK